MGKKFKELSWPQRRESIELETRSFMRPITGAVREAIISRALDLAKDNGAMEVEDVQRMVRVVASEIIDPTALAPEDRLKNAQALLRRTMENGGVKGIEAFTGKKKTK